ncbi:MAG TPA: PepSY domain-containing protein [Candidatus Mediterraneibacter norfolkensis]|nr:PepSY domain-containing protein [Candidatus Mediterraneibacter norfolkensis]
MKSRYILTMAGIILTFALLAGCGSVSGGGTQGGGNTADSGSSEREEELQAEIDSLREELDALKNEQNSQSSSAGQSENGDAAPSQNNGGSSRTESGGQTPSGAQISMEEAMQIALDRVPGATEQNISIELERDDGWLIYEGDILYNRMEYEFEIDAQSGMMLKWEEEAW